jgi:hypothetical protein
MRISVSGCTHDEAFNKSMKVRFLATGYNLLECGRDDRPRRLVATDLAGFARATSIVPLCRLGSIFRFRTRRFDLLKWAVLPDRTAR